MAKAKAKAKKPQKWPMSRDYWNRQHPRSKAGTFKKKKRQEQLSMFPKIRR